FPRSSEAPSAPSLLNPFGLGLRFSVKEPFLFGGFLAFLGKGFPLLIKVVAITAPPDHFCLPSLPSLRQLRNPCLLFENTDPPFASPPPALRSAKPTLLLLPGSGLIPPFLIGNCYPLDP